MPDNPIEEMREHAADVAVFLKTMANENRLLILCCLLDGEQTVGQVHQQLALSASALSQHLAWLRDAGMVSTRRQSQSIYYRITDDRVLRIMQLLKSMFCK